MITGMPRIAIATHDFSATVAAFRDALGMPVIDLSATSVDSLGAKLAMCTPPGGSNIELMSPARPTEPLSQSLQRFLERRGEGLFALMLEAPDPDAEADELAGRGLNVLPLMAGASGRDIHPNSTHGVLIRIYPVDSFRGSATDADSGESLGLSGIERVVIAVRNLDHAMDVYGNKLGLDASPSKVDAHRGVKSALCRPPSGGAIELVCVADPKQTFAGAIQKFLDDRGEGMYALVLKSPAPAKLADAMTARGLRVNAAADSADTLEIEPASFSGALLRIEKS